mmetsp:Transcript_75087/g.176133  ORF Transcript_75087/g.176133 Transcript_75087/m.176133 type:complete len:88 (-) Transcript_75087:792-1055(-)
MPSCHDQREVIPSLSTCFWRSCGRCSLLFWLGMDSVDDSGNSWGLMKLNFPIGASTAVFTWMPVCLYVAWRRIQDFNGLSAVDGPLG